MCLFNQEKIGFMIPLCPLATKYGSSLADSLTLSQFIIHNIDTTLI